jgi:DNA-binding NarL/FixJ family response regulator
MIRLAIVEDDPRQLHTLARLFSAQADMVVSASHASAEAALSAGDWSAVDLVLVDLDLPGLSGAQLVTTLANDHPGLICLVHTIHDDRENLFQALRAGACGYALKGTSAADLLKAVRDASQGESPISPAIARHLVQELCSRSTTGEDVLSVREIALLRLAADGYLYKEIADRLYISTHTVHTHIKKIYAKLQAASRSEAVLKARKLGYLGS